ncbi:hypothetical protein IWW39_004292 [Coemansia spiralis]|uniref:Transcription initiation factor TFIID subunit 1 histone acetyltransferase domain-containing protein n=1 Tax=Coemansia spiralis TaxID=417178 RepID=A0A9W8L3H1_9FUNG|nr:hypothetical protein IWW39_004292 [Coemansia spiralis]
MSLTGFLFGNVDEEGHLSDNELDSELRNTLGGEDTNEYLSGILGSALFSEGAPTKRDDDEDEDDDGAAGPSSTPAIKPQRDAIDYSDFNELADDAAVPRRDKWGDDAGFKYGTTVERAQVDDDYDDDEEEDAEQAGLAEGNEESLEDLFDSPEIKPADSDDASGRPTGLHLASPETTPPPASLDVLEEEAVVPRPVKRIIPSGPIKFTDYFGCHVTRQVKRRRRQPPPQQDDDDDDLEGQLTQRPTIVDTRKLLAGPQSLLLARSESGFVQAVVSQSMADDTSCDVYVTIDERTGAETSQRTVPRRAADPAAAVFQDTAYPLALDDWEQRIMWDDDDDKVKAEPVTDDVLARQVLAQTGGELVSDFEAHVIWDPDTAFLPSTRLQINLNDAHMLLESGVGEAKHDASVEWRGGMDRLNQSNDHHYAVQQSGKAHRVRQTFGQLVVAHSLAALKLQAPFFRVRLTKPELRSWHRPMLQASADMVAKFSRVRSARRRGKHSGDTPWAAKDVTLRDSADCILVEYSEEYPLVVSNVGMGSVVVNYYRKRHAADHSFPKVSLGELFVLDVADISPFLGFGNVDPGQVVPALYNNMFRAPLFAQPPTTTDFLIVKTAVKGEAKWFVRPVRHHFVAGQTFPLQEVPAPHSRRVTTTVKHRLQVAAYRLMNRNQYHLLQMARLARVFPEYTELQIRQRLKEFCEYQRKGLGAGYWRPKHTMPIPDEDALRKMLTPEMLCLYESMRVCQLHLLDAGKSGSELDDDDDTTLPIEEALATWNLTRNFINATQGKAMLQLYGEGDPTARGEGFSFVRVSMKDIFLRAGESVEEKLAEIEARPKSAHRYNVAEQQQIYKDEITSIWNRQRRSLTRPNTTKLGDAYSDDNIIVPEINDGYGDAAIARSASAIDSSRAAPGTAMEVSQRLVQPQSTQVTAHANFIMTNKKGLVIRRAVQSPYTGELMWRTEVIRDQAVIQAYLRQRRIIENMAHNRSANEDEGDDLFGTGEDHIVDLPAETRIHLSDLKRALGTREADARNLVKSHMTTFSLPQPNKPKKEVIRRCGNCGQLGHMKTNKKCPRYFEFNPV